MVPLAQANHYGFTSNETDVLRDANAFLAEAASCRPGELARIRP